jgi:hypothetical protein
MNRRDTPASPANADEGDPLSTATNGGVAGEFMQASDSRSRDPGISVHVFLLLISYPSLSLSFFLSL